MPIEDKKGWSTHSSSNQILTPKPGELWYVKAVETTGCQPTYYLVIDCWTFTKILDWERKIFDHCLTVTFLWTDYNLQTHVGDFEYTKDQWNEWLYRKEP